MNHREKNNNPVSLLILSLAKANQKATKELEKERARFEVPITWKDPSLDVEEI